MNLKRDNWTSDEVVRLINGQRLIGASAYAARHNVVIYDVIQSFLYANNEFAFGRPWSNDAILRFLEDEEKRLPEPRADEVSTIDALRSLFLDFQRPETSFGALAFDTESGRVFHIGTLPTQ